MKVSGRGICGRVDDTDVICLKKVKERDKKHQEKMLLMKMPYTHIHSFFQCLKTERKWCL